MIALTSHLKRWICRVLIGMLLSTQFAVAAYACPELGGQAAQAVAPTPAHAVHPSGFQRTLLSESDGEHGLMDPTFAHLCNEHCQFGQQKSDHTPAPSLSPVLLTALYTLPSLGSLHELGPAQAAYRVPAAGDPPHAILHCCLRD